ncbi:DUF3192 domain-containing protein [Aliikangiella marina]|uniref:DUF3192 domain-containing protein n=1 Tax=Aliikangiella marina TaxID=1712262 RepID=A0A545TBZ5_9GAMM|nr:DUF3192 domain-containing protein [Aliikangiella marina]TQV74737.1 DUF3192 domain-containing protein [Aliikangiella marina]
MKYLTNIAISAFLASSLTGCVIIDTDDGWEGYSSWKSRQEDNRKAISNLELGTERSAIVSELGAPDFSEAFTAGQDQYRVLYYRTHHTESDGDTTKDETTPLIFKNNTLIGWGNEALSSIKN